MRRVDGKLAVMLGSGAVIVIAAASIGYTLLRPGPVRAPASQASESRGIDWRATIGEEDRRWLDETIPAATPNAFSDDLTQVMASLDERHRELIVIFRHGHHERYIAARAWALRDDTMTGDPEELRPLLDALEGEVVIDKWGDYAPDSPDEYRRNTALTGLQRAVASGRYSALHDRIEQIAMKHQPAPVFRGNAVILLMLLSEKGDLSPGGATAMDTALQDRGITLDRIKRGVRNAYHDAQLVEQD
jgi:hypothetical protein